MWAFLTALATAIIGGLATYFGNKRADDQAIAGAKDQAVKDAATETQEVITDAADARSALRPAAGADDLIARLRARAESRGGEGGS